MKLIVLFFIFILSSQTQAASCCGGGFSIPSLILGDDKAQATGTFSASKISDDVFENGKWLKRNDDNLTQTFKLDSATLISDLWQAGLSIPVLTKSTKDQTATSGLGDVSLFLGHETFTETSYSRWRPKGVSYVQLTLPTSSSIYDTTSNQATEIRGRGFYSLGAGVALVKSWKVWDVNFNTEIHRSLPRHFNNSIYNGEVNVQPGWGFSQTWGMGWSRGDLRVGSSLSFLYEDPIQISGATNTQSSLQKNMTFALLASYMMTPESAVTMSYADQSLFGEPINSALTKTLNVSYQQRWPR